MRACQSQSMMHTLVPQRTMKRVDIATLEYIHSLTHRTDAANVRSILEHGLRPSDRTLHLSAFPKGHHLHAESSKDYCNVEIILKMQQTLMETATEGMWLCGATRNLHLSVTVPAWLIWAIFLSYKEEGPWAPTPQWE